eukprot:TRINITY_DN45303_c0_g2_i1.p2 TRINITY_DN45303_c0_g2~~TRINITY_DN45303_c0_g2_i1.p2  ORF type:complete len:580 (+),score=111.60 TRINITY_DN45303_c0_g2_i1:138-1877(+)
MAAIQRPDLAAFGITPSWAERPYVRPRLRAQSACGPRRAQDPAPDVRPAGLHPPGRLQHGARVEAADAATTAAEGVTPGGDHASGAARQCLQPDRYDEPRPQTDEARPRSAFVRQKPDVGRSRVPKGQEDLPLQVDGMGYGRPTGRSEGVERLIRAPRAQSAGGYAEVMEEQREQVYESRRREPLGRGYVRGHTLPAKTQEPGFRYGQGTGAPRHFSDQQGKDAIAPRADLDAPNQAAVDAALAQAAESLHAAREAAAKRVHSQYVRSHQAFAPGEQLDRRYAWPDDMQDPQQFAFGRQENARNKDGAGVKSIFAGDGCTAQALDDQGKAADDPKAWAPPTRIVPKTGEDARWYYHHSIGQPAGRTQAANRPPVPAHFAFGAPSRVKAKHGQPDEVQPSAGELIRGNYTVEEQMPDRDLGRCTKDGRRNLAPDDRYFGKPTRPPSRSGSVARGDGEATPTVCVSPYEEPAAFAPRPRRPAFADDEPDAFGQGVASALMPGLHTQKGLHSDEFRRERGCEEVKLLLQSAGYSVEDERFQRAWSEAVRCAQSPYAASASADKASLEAVVQAFAKENAMARM